MCGCVSHRELRLPEALPVFAVYEIDKKIVLNYKYVVSFGVILKREKILSNQGVFSLYQLSLTTLLHL